MAEIPVYGAILLNQKFDKILLVMNFNCTTYSFPKGKVNMNENGIACATREVWYDFYLGKKLDLIFNLWYQKKIILNIENKIEKKLVKCILYLMLMKKLNLRQTQEMK